MISLNDEADRDEHQDKDDAEGDQRNRQQAAPAVAANISYRDLDEIKHGRPAFFPPEQATVFQRINNLGFAYDSGIVSRKDECGAEIISHLFHQSENHIRGLMIQVCGRLIREYQLRPGDQRAGDGNPLLLTAGKLIRHLILLL
jgi:hypothetical protein